MDGYGGKPSASESGGIAWNNRMMTAQEIKFLQSGVEFLVLNRLYNRTVLEDYKYAPFWFVRKEGNVRWRFGRSRGRV